MELVWEVIGEAFLDALKLVPFLFVTFLIVEWVEHHTEGKMEAALVRARRSGPLWGAVLGLIPQCGFSVMAANLYSGGLVTLGTMIAVFLATSDEAIILILGDPGSIGAVLPLLACKLGIGIVFGFLIDFIVRRTDREDLHEPHDLCEDCGCENYEGVVRPAAWHTGTLFLYILAFNLALGFALEFIGAERISELLLSDTHFQPFLTALIGLIPNCGASVLLAGLFINGAISFGSALAGLLAGAGVGLAILFRMHRCTHKNVAITALLYGIAVLCGILVNLAA